MHYQQETFFRPDEVRRETVSLPADLHNRCRLLLGRDESGCVFVPIRSMQFQGIITNDEIIFVDSQGGYVVRDGHGGRVILLSWAMRPEDRPESLVKSVPVDLILYAPGARDTHRRLMSEFPKALDRLEEKQREKDRDLKRITVLPFRRDRNR